MVLEQVWTCFFVTTGGFIVLTSFLIFREINNELTIWTILYRQLEYVITIITGQGKRLYRFVILYS